MKDSTSTGSAGRLTPSTRIGLRACASPLSTFSLKGNLQCARFCKDGREHIEAAIPTLVVLVTVLRGAESGMREDDFGGVASGKEFDSDLRFRAFGMQLGAIGCGVGPTPGEDDLFRRLYFEVDALAPVDSVLGGIANFYQIAAAGANVLLMMNDRVRGDVLAHPLL